MFVIRGELPKSNQVVIIDIDDRSLKEVGQWPWSRNKIAELIDTLADAKAGIIGLDMVFAEPDRTSPHLLKKTFPQLPQSLPNYDEILAKTFTTAPVVGGYIFSPEKTKDTRTPLIPAVFIQQGLQDTEYLTQAEGIILNTPMLQSSLYSSGFFNTNTSYAGGVIRSTPLIQKYKGDIYTSLAFEMVRIYSGADRVKIVGDEQGVSFIEVGEYLVPTDHTGELLINFRGPQKHFKYISVSDILNGNFDPKDIENKFILIGTSALGLKDLRATPYDSTSPGVEVHANVIDNILQGDFIEKPFVARLYDLAIIWVLAFSLILLFSFINSFFIIPMATFLLGLMLYLLYVSLFSYGLVLTLVTPILVFISTLIFSLAIDYVIASKHREQARRILGKKVSTSVMHHLLAHADDDLIASKEVEATIFFSDIRSFTSISEQIGSPTKVIKLLNTYMTPMVDTIIEHKGTIDKFIGDAIMAYWNAPVPVENHADAALSSAIRQIEQLQGINQTIQAEYGVNIHIGIGIHTGMVTAGDMGSEGRSDYTIIGDHVNFASRLENLTKVYGVQVLISNATYKQLKGDYSIRPIDIVEVKGKSKTVEIFEVICGSKHVAEEEMQLYKKAVILFRDGKVDKAHDLFAKLHTKYGSKLYGFYIQRCKKFIDNPHLPFTPVFKMTHK